MKTVTVEIICQIYFRLTVCLWLDCQIKSLLQNVNNTANKCDNKITAVLTVSLILTIIGDPFEIKLHERPNIRQHTALKDEKKYPVKKISLKNPCMNVDETISTPYFFLQNGICRIKGFFEGTYDTACDDVSIYFSLDLPLSKQQNTIGINKNPKLINPPATIGPLFRFSIVVMVFFLPIYIGVPDLIFEIEWF